MAQHCSKVSACPPPFGYWFVGFHLGPQWDPARVRCGPRSVLSRQARTGRKFSQAASKYRHAKATLHHPRSSNRTRTCRTFVIWTSLQPSFVQQGERSTEIPSACYFSLCVSMSQSQLKNNPLHCIWEKDPHESPANLFAFHWFYFTDCMQHYIFSQCCYQMHSEEPNSWCVLTSITSEMKSAFHSIK